MKEKLNKKTEEEEERLKESDIAPVTMKRKS